MLDERKKVLAEEVLLRIEQLVKLKYEEEVEREASLISQASNMQTVFSVSSAALFMLLPTIGLILGGLYFFISPKIRRMVWIIFVSSFSFLVIACL